MNRDDNENKKLYWILGGLGGAVIVLIIAVVIAAVGHGGDAQETEPAQTKEERLEAFDEMMEDIEKMKNEQISAARAEANATNDPKEKGKAFSKRINEMLAMGEGNVAGALIDAGDEYFADAELPAGALAMYVDINYDKLTTDSDIYYYYQDIMDLADQVGDEEVKKEWQDRYDEAKANFDLYNSYTVDDEGFDEDFVDEEYDDE